MKKKLIVAGAGLTLLLISGALIGVALAADPTPTPNGSNTPYQTFITKLAKILGIQEQQLTDAVKKARTEMVDDDLKTGKLTPDQANKLKEGIDKGNGWGAPMHGGRGPAGPGGPEFGRGFGPMHGTEMTDVASLLGVKPEDLMAELKTGKTLAQVGQEHGKTRDQLKRAIVAGIQKSVDKAVADGKLTKVKADEIVKNAGTQADRMLDGSFKAPNGVPA